MFQKATLTLATLGLVYSLSATTVPVRTSHRGDVRDIDKIEKPQKPEDPKKPDDPIKHRLHAAGRNNCPIYYNCPAPAPAPPKGGGNKPGEPQKPALHV